MRGLNEAPKTAGIPLFGSWLQLFRDPFGFLRQAREAHGDIYRLDLGFTKVVMLNHPSHAQHVLRDRVDNYRKGGAFWEPVRAMLGDGLLVSEGDVWLSRRRAVQPQFQRNKLTDLSDLMVQEAARSMETWGPPNGGVFDLGQAFDRLTMRVSTRALMGSSLTDAEMTRASESITYCLDRLFSAAITHKLPSWLPVPGRAKFLGELERFDEVAYALLERCDGARDDEHHLTKLLLEVMDDGGPRQDVYRRVRDELATLLLAGYETTSKALLWTSHYLAVQPELQARVAQEVDRALQGRTPTASDLAAMPLTRQVIQEALRIRPPGFWLPREAVNADAIDGFDIRRGQTVVVYTYGLHQNPTIWTEPERFDPERFSAAQSAERHRFAYIPFGGGQRLCIGREFALMEAQLVLCLVLQRYALQALPGHDARPEVSATLRPRAEGVRLALTTRVADDAAWVVAA